MILSAAADLFAEQGYQQTSLADVAARSGVSRGSIPWHFGDKQGLLAAVVDDVYETASASRAAAPLRPGPEGAVDIGRMATRAVRSRSTRLLLALLLEAGRPDSPIRDSFIKLHDNFRDHVSGWARHPEVQSQLPEGVSPDAIAVMVFGTVIGVNQQWTLSPDRVDLDATYTTLTRMLLSFIGQRDFPLDGVDTASGIDDD